MSGDSQTPSAPVPGRRAAVPHAPVLATVAGGAVVLSPDGEIEQLNVSEAAGRLKSGPHVLIHARFTARRLGLRIADMAPPLDVLELFSFVYPAQFCTPTPAGLARALGLEAPQTPDDQVLAIHDSVRVLVEALVSHEGSDDDREMAAALAHTMEAAGWSWGPAATAALGKPAGYAKTGWMTGLEAWKKLPEWEEQAGRGKPGNRPVAPEEAAGRLRQLVGRDAEERLAQRDYAGAVSAAFLPREPGEPHVVLAEAGTGTGKTLGYIAPASLWAERNDGAVWLSTYTKNLQRQLDQELTRLYPDPAEKAEKVVLRKGRENYLCLLNYEEAVGRAAPSATLAGAGGNRTLIPLGLIARWIRASRDGDMVGGDFPSWLVPGAARAGQDGGIGLTDRRGECIYSACPHYRKCFIERAVRKSKHASMVVANHALVLTQAANAQIPTGTVDQNDGRDTEGPHRIVFDEGHHVFDAADSAFAVALSGFEAAELRRWIRGAEARRARRSRGLRERVADLIEDMEDGPATLEAAEEAARCLPAPGWGQRLQMEGPQGAAETFLSLVRAQVIARTSDDRSPFSLETEVSPPIEGLADAAEALARRLNELARPLRALSGLLSKRLADEAETLETATRVRIETAQRSILRRSGGLIPAWIAMLGGIGREPDEAFVEWFEVERMDGRERDVAMRRHWLDPTRPLAEVVLEPSQGAVITSATLRDAPVTAEAVATDADAVLDAADWASADVRTGAMHLPVPALRASFASPFDFARQARVFSIHDLGRARPEVIAGAYRALFEAAGGGALGIFTAIARLRAVHGFLQKDLEAAGLPLYAQHVDAMDVGTLVDIFRNEKNSCLLGTDAVRDGVDVPGDSLRLLVFDRVPWPRPDILHKARRAAFGGGRYDDMIARLRLRQAFGRLIRTADDKGVFVILAPLPSKLKSALPPGVEVERLGLADVVAATREFLRD